MPTAAKLEKQLSLEIQDPQKLVQNLVDKKIRNLEKRKARLQELKDNEAKGQTLEPEQLIAIKKLDQVVEMIDLMKDLNKSLTEALTENNKQQKKLAKKEQLDKQLERQQQELDRLKTILQFQDTLNQLDSSVRQDFIKGTNGAVKLTEEELSHLDKLYSITCDPLEKQMDSSAEKWMALAEGKPREAWVGVTFHQLRELLTKIVDSKYFATETNKSTTTSTGISSKSNAVTIPKAEESKKQLAKESEPSITSKSTSSQFQTMTTSDVSVLNLSQLQSPINSGISFMRDSMVENELQHKDPAVVAVSSVPNFSYHNQYGVQTNEHLVSAQISNSIPISNSSSINTQKVSSFESGSTIPTQTFTNQNFATTLIPGNAAFVPVTIATSGGALVHSIPIQGMVAQDLSGHQVNASDLGVQHNYQNHHNFMDSNQDKHLNTSQDRSGTNFANDDNNGYRNNRMRGRGGNARTNQNNVNGYGNRARNGNKGSGGFPVTSYGGGYQKYDNNTINNGSSFGNNFETKGQNNFAGNRGRQQNRGNRTDRGHNNRNFNANYAATTAAK